MECGIKKKTYKLYNDLHFDRRKVSRWTRRRWERKTETNAYIKHFGKILNTSAESSIMNIESYDSSTLNELVSDEAPRVISNKHENDIESDDNVRMQKTFQDSDQNKVDLEMPLIEVHVDTNSDMSATEDDTDEVTNSTNDYSDSDSEESECKLKQNTETIGNANESFTNDNRLMFPSSGLTVSDVLLMLEAITIKYSTTREMQVDFMNFVSKLAGPTFESWNYSPYLMSKILAPPNGIMKKNYYCSECNVLLEEISLSETKKTSMKCEKCLKVHFITSKSLNYFISLDVKYQLENLLNRKDIQKCMFDYAMTEKNNAEMTDITDSELYKNNLTDSDVLSFNFSIDGAQLFKSAKKSLWPLQLYLNCLSGRMRFKHPIIVALWQTEKEPTPSFMNLFMSVLVKQCDKLLSTGITFTDYNTGLVCTKKIVPFCCCVDSVARPIVQNRVQFNGHSGCSWCYHFGVYYAGSMRYPVLDDDPELRTHEKTFTKHK